MVLKGRHIEDDVSLRILGWNLSTFSGVIYMWVSGVPV
jgi:hypothetical protein